MATMQGSNLTSVKKQNDISIRTAIYKYAPVSRSEIAEMLSLTPPTITTNVASLIRQGVVQELTGNPQSEHGLGRKPVLLDFRPDCHYFLGVELGPYDTVICLVDLRGRIIASLVEPPAPDDYKSMFRLVHALCRDVIDQSGVDQKLILGMGVGMPGFVENDHGTLRTGVRTQWIGQNVAGDLSDALGFPVQLENNARLRAFGEEMFASELRPDNFAYFFVSKGIACPLFIRNRLFAGGNAGAGEVGHMVMQRDGIVCPTCGNQGCLEGISGEKAILERCREAMRSGVHTILSDICPDETALTMGDVLKAQQMNDRIVCSIMQDAVTYLGIALGNIINFISPELVIVDGYIMKNPQNRELFTQVVNKNMFALYNNELNIEFVEFDRLRGARGAAAFAVSEFFLKS